MNFFCLFKALGGCSADYSGRPIPWHIGDDYRIGREEFHELYGRLKKLIEGDFVNLQKKLEAAGVPWTPGRAIPRVKGS